MNQSRRKRSPQKAGKQKPESDKQNFTKSNDNRSAKTSNFLPKMATDTFQIRKPLNIYMIEELNALGRKTYFQRVFILALNNAEETLAEYLQHLDFPEYVQRHLDDIFGTCEKKKCTSDHLSGLFVAMGNTHTYLMVEGAEDMIANFFEELDLVHDRIWRSSRVFLVEDKIGETYFNNFYSRRSAAININEKFPPSTSNDYNLMAVQHLKVKEKVKSVVETLSMQLAKESTHNIGRSRDNIRDDPLYLPEDTFNKVLPEIQRIDLVLNANKFYRTVKDFSQTYRVLQLHQDEDSFMWPIQNNYTPLEIFKRSEFDVNLTFGLGGKEESNQTPRNESVDTEEVKDV